MYCPKCKRKYTDGSLKCRDCNKKLIVRLPMEKVKKKKRIYCHNPVRLENKRKEGIFELLFGKIFCTKLFYIFLIGGLLIYFIGMIVAFENMVLKDALLVVNILGKIGSIMFLTSFFILFGYDLERWKWFKKLEIKNETASVIIKGMLILIVVTGEINMLSKPVLDFVYKDHYVSQGTVTKISEGLRGSLTLYVDHKGYSYTKRLKSVTIGQTYTFTYSKRSHLILDIK